MADGARGHHPEAHQAHLHLHLRLPSRITLPILTAANMPRHSQAVGHTCRHNEGMLPCQSWDLPRQSQAVYCSNCHDQETLPSQSWRPPPHRVALEYIADFSDAVTVALAAGMGP